MMKSALKKLLALLLLACGNALGATSVPEPSLQTLPLSELEQRLESIDTELSDLSNSSLRTGVGNLGWISNLREGDPGMEWAQVELGEPALIDQVVLVPVIWRDSKGGVQADSFPREFRLITGTSASLNPVPASSAEGFLR
jgi:hypothetical protein